MDNNTNASSKTDGSGPIYIEEKITKTGGDPIIKKYLQGRLLGKGGFAKCYEITSLDTKKVLAAKIICKATLNKSRAKQKLISEIKIHKSIRHPNVVGFEHVFEDQENVYILLELCSNQSMHDLLKRRKRLTELEVQSYVIQMINGLKYLHGRKIIHRDLKLGNLFLNDKMELKLGDFGLAAKLEFDGEKRRTVCGTPNYIAPEIIEGKTGHSYEVDTWSLGVIIYTLIVGRPPFETSDVKLTYKKIKACSYTFPEQSSISENAKDLIIKMLNLDASKRPSLDDILQHPFLKSGVNVPKLLPASTLTRAPSSHFLDKFCPPENLVKVPLQPPREVETAPLGVPKGSRFVNTLKNNLVGSDKPTVHSPHSATTQATQAHTNENINSVPCLDRPSTKDKGLNFAKTGAWQSGLNSAQSLKDISRPHSVQQKDFRSTQGFKTTINPMTSLGNRLRGTGVSGGISRDRTTTSSNEIWVKKWVDYSSKYGMGYVLSNGTTGVFFNDNTKILLDSKGEQFNYVQRNRVENQDVVNSYSTTEYPKEIQKKITLLNHFRKYLDGNEQGVVESNNTQESVNTASIYVKKWVKTKSATLFRLSNKTVQVNFTDKTEIILNSENKQVTYVNKKGERNNFPLATALENNNADMTKRLKYAKDLLASMINGTQPSQMPTLNL
jgi:polo-like kinase 1